MTFKFKIFEVTFDIRATFFTFIYFILLLLFFNITKLMVPWSNLLHLISGKGDLILSD